MAQDLQDPSNKAVHTQGRRQHLKAKLEDGLLVPGAQGGTNKAKSETKGEEKETKGDKSDDDNKEQGNSKENNKKRSSASSTKDNETPMKPAAKTSPSSRQQDNLEDSNKAGRGSLMMTKKMNSSHVMWMCIVRNAILLCINMTGFGLQPTGVAQ